MKKSEWVIFFFFLYSLRIAFFDEFFFSESRVFLQKKLDI